MNEIFKEYFLMEKYISKLYILYSEIFKEDKEFWIKLSLEEENKLLRDREGSEKGHDGADDELVLFFWFIYLIPMLFMLNFSSMPLKLSSYLQLYEPCIACSKVYWKEDLCMQSETSLK